MNLADDRKSTHSGLGIAWERASDDWGTPSLIALRTAMVRDVAALERTARRRAR